MYTITNYTRKQAKKLRVTIKRSTNPSKKIDVFKNGIKISSCGATGYNDYPTFMKKYEKKYGKKYGKKYADHRRKLYKNRHEKDRKIVGTPGYYADKLLW